MLWLIFSFLLTFLLYVYTIDSLSYWKKRNVPSEEPLPLFGNLLYLALGKEHFWSMIERMYNKFDGKYFGIYVSHKPILIIKDRDMIKQILMKDFSSFVNRTNHSNEKVDPFISNTLFVLTNEFWKTIRKKLSPVMTTGKMKEVLPLMAEKASTLEYILEKCNNKNVDFKNLTKNFSIDIFASCFFGIRSENLMGENLELRNLIDKMFDNRTIMRRVASFCWVLCPILVDLFRLSFFEIKSRNDFANLYLHTEEDRKRRNIERYDLMSLMMNLSEQETQHRRLKFDDVKRTAQALQFLTTGTEALAYSASKCLYELAMNPRIQENLRREIRENLDSDGNISYEALSEMEYLDLVIKESLRRHPFMPFITRYAEKDYIFESTGLQVEKGTQVIIPTTAIHDDPKYYPNPSKFDPERYRGFKMQYVYLPFGEGPRKCVGERLTLITLKLAVAKILKKFEVHPGEKTDIPLKFAQNSMFASTVDGSIWLKIKTVE